MSKLFRGKCLLSFLGYLDSHDRVDFALVDISKSVLHHFICLGQEMKVCLTFETDTLSFLVLERTRADGILLI